LQRKSPFKKSDPGKNAPKTRKGGTQGGEWRDKKGKNSAAGKRITDDNAHEKAILTDLKNTERKRDTEERREERAYPWRWRE